MHVEVKGTRLWFDVDGPALVPDGAGMRERPTVVLVHGGPGSFDHSYFKPDFARLADVAQVVYLDLPGHGRSDSAATRRRGASSCAPTPCATSATRSTSRGRSCSATPSAASSRSLYGRAIPAMPRRLVLQSTFARFDLTGIVEGFRRVGGDEVAEIASAHYSGDARR